MGYADIPNGSKILIQDDFKDFISRSFSDKDKLAFNLHSNQIQNNKYPETGILRNFCNRTGVNLERFIKYVKGNYWNEIYHQLVARKIL